MPDSDAPTDARPAFRRVTARRVVATAAALDALRAEPSTICLRLAPDEVLMISDSAHAPGATGDMPTTHTAPIADGHAIDVEDAGWSAVRCPEEVVLDFMSRATTWQVPKGDGDALGDVEGPGRPLLLQGMAAGVPVKIWLDGHGHALVLVPTPMAHDLQGRWT